MIVTRLTQRSLPTNQRPCKAGAAG